MPLRTLNEIFNVYAPASDTLGSLPGRPNKARYENFAGLTLPSGLIEEGLSRL
ncbi:MAG: hypothetical protein AAF654_07865 [Myxococcota bacterium]